MAHDPGVSVVTSDKDDVVEHLHQLGVVAVVRCQTSERLTEVVAALHGGGIRAIEITLTTPGAVELMRDLAAHFDPLDVLVGAGTVVDVGQAAAGYSTGRIANRQGTECSVASVLRRGGDSNRSLVATTGPTLQGIAVTVDVVCS